MEKNKCSTVSLNSKTQSLIDVTCLFTVNNDHHYDHFIFRLTDKCNYLPPNFYGTFSNRDITDKIKRLPDSS